MPTNAPNGQPCPDHPTWTRFLVGELDSGELERLSAHLERCAACLDWVNTRAETEDEVIACLRQAPQPDRVLDDPAYEQVLARLRTLARRESAEDEAERFCIGTGKRLGRFTLRTVVGAGGSAIVWRAYDASLAREVALKVPRTHDMLTEHARRRFAKEAEAAAGLSHPNILPIIDTGEAEGVPYIVMEFCRGPNLGQWLSEQNEPVPARLAASVTASLAEAAGAAHKAGVLHRDIKPSNVLLFPSHEAGEIDRDDFPFHARLTDFGLAKLRFEETGDASAGGTLSGATIGTPAYMAPEQTATRNRALDGRTDIWALGVLLYQVLTDRPPFQGESVVETLAQIGSQPPVPPGLLRRGLPRDLETICLKCLEKSPSRRYATAAELAADLRRFVAGDPIKARPLSPLERAWRSARKRPVVSTLCAAAVICAALIGGLQARHNRVLTKNNQELKTKGHALRLQLYVAEINQAWRALELGRVNEAKARLDRLAPAPGDDPADDPRGFEWSLLRRLSHDRKEVRAFQAHTGLGSGLDFSPDGTRLATCGANDNLVKLWDAGSGELLATFTGHASDVNRVRFSPDGRWLASASDDRTVRVWDVAKRALRQVLKGYPGRVFDVAFAREGRWIVAAGKEFEVWFWDSHTGTRVGGVLDDSRLRRFQVSIRGNTLLTAHDDGKVRQWLIPSGEGAFELRSPQSVLDRRVDSVISDLALAPNAQRLAVSWHEGTITFRDIPSGKIVNLVRKHKQCVNGLAFSPDGRFLASADDSGEVRVWTADGAALQALQVPDDNVEALAFSPTGLLATMSRSGIMRIWNPRARDDHHLAVNAIPRPFSVGLPCLLPDLKAVAIIETNGWLLRILEVFGRKEVFRSPIRPLDVRRAASPDSRWLATSGRGYVEVWSVMERAAAGGFQASKNHAPVIPLAFTKDGRFLAISENPRTEVPSVVLWDWRLGRKKASFVGHSRIIVAAAFSSEGRTLATGSIDAETNTILWDVETARAKFVLRGHTREVSSLAFSPDDQTLATASHDRTVRLWNVATGQTVAVLPHDLAAIQSVAFSRDGKTLVSGDAAGTVTFWNLATKQELFRMPHAHSSPVEAIAFSTDGHVLQTSAWPGEESGEVNQWDVAGPADALP